MAEREEDEQYEESEETSEYRMTTRLSAAYAANESHQDPAEQDAAAGDPAPHQIPLYDSMHGTKILGLVTKIFNLEYDRRSLGGHTRGVGRLRDGTFYVVRYLTPEEDRLILRAFPVSRTEARNEIIYHRRFDLLRDFFGEELYNLDSEPGDSLDTRVLVWDGNRGYIGYATLVFNVREDYGVGKLADGRYYLCEVGSRHNADGTYTNVPTAHVLSLEEAIELVSEFKPELFPELFGGDLPVLD